jgi:hypothetical protein
VPLLTFTPDFDGDVFEWQGNPIGLTYLAVADIHGSDGDVSWLGERAAGDAFLVGSGVAAPPFTVARVSWVGVLATARFHAPGGPAGTIAQRIKSGGVTYEGPTADLFDTYTDIGWPDNPDWIAEQDPGTGQPWTIAGALAAQFGIVDRTAGAHSIRCTTIRKLVWVEGPVIENAVRWRR